MSTTTEALATIRTALLEHWGPDCETDFLDLYMNDPKGHGRRSVIYSALASSLPNAAAVDAIIDAIPTAEA